MHLVFPFVTIKFLHLALRFRRAWKRLLVHFFSARFDGFHPKIQLVPVKIINVKVAHAVRVVLWLIQDSGPRAISTPDTGRPRLLQRR